LRLPASLVHLFAQPVGIGARALELALQLSDPLVELLPARLGSLRLPASLGHLLAQPVGVGASALALALQLADPPVELLPPGLGLHRLGPPLRSGRTLLEVGGRQRRLL